MTRPEMPSTMTVIPSSRNFVTLGAPTTAGISSALAMIAVCDVGPPFSSTSAETRCWRSAVAPDGGRSCATSTDPASRTTSRGSASGFSSVRSTRRPTSMMSLSRALRMSSSKRCMISM